MMQGILLVGAAAIVTALIRFLPFVLFDHGSEPPEWIVYLGKVLPPAVMSVLILYCVRNENIFVGDRGIPEILCIGIAMILHAWKRNTILSICVSTALYMVLVQAVFV